MGSSTPEHILDSLYTFTPSLVGIITGAHGLACLQASEIHETRPSALHSQHHLAARRLGTPIVPAPMIAVAQLGPGCSCPGLPRVAFRPEQPSLWMQPRPTHLPVSQEVCLGRCPVEVVQSARWAGVRRLGLCHGSAPGGADSTNRPARRAAHASPIR